MGKRVFEHPGLKTKFAIPDPLTLGDVERWEEGRTEALRAGARTSISVAWAGARAIIQDWQSDILPDLTDPPATISGEQIKVIVWAGKVVEAAILELTNVPNLP